MPKMGGWGALTSQKKVTSKGDSDGRGSEGGRTAMIT